MTPRERLDGRGLLVLVEGTCRAAGVSLDEVLGRGKSRFTATARHLVFAALRERGLSYPEIGRLMGVGHSTVRAGVQRATERAPRDQSALDRQILRLDAVREALRAI